MVHRSDGSGTSYIWTDYLSKVSPEWKTKVGFATGVNWPVGLGGKGNEGVTQQVKSVEGTIGYVELIYARWRTISPFADVKNAAGNFVTPSPQTVTTNAAARRQVPAEHRFPRLDHQRPGSAGMARSPRSPGSWMRPDMTDRREGQGDEELP